MDFFTLIEYVLSGILVLYGLYFAYDLIKERNAGPPLWQEARKKGAVSARLLKEARRYGDKIRFYNFWLQTQRLKKDKVEGAFAELGVYKGDSALVLHLMAPERTFHLFDTFGGFEEADLKPETGEAADYSPHNFADTSLERVKQRLSSPQFVFHPGHFPGTARVVADERFALVNLDADLYLPTKAALEFFYPRLSPGGVIFIHDYNAKWKGLMKAVDEFVKTIPEPLVLLPDKDSTVMIVKSKGV